KDARAVDDEGAALDAAHLLTVHVLHLDDAELLAQCLVRVRDEFEREAHLRLEAFVRLQAVARDAEDDGARSLEPGMARSKVYALGRAAGGVVLWIKIQ